MKDEFIDLDATAQAELVARGEVRATELVEVTLARIGRIDPAIHAIASLDPDRALAAAAAIDARPRDATRGAFAGVPFLAKDVLAVPGFRCTFGTRLFAQHVPEAGSAYTERFDRAGLVMLGKTTTSEFGLLGSTEAKVFGEPTRNPWDPTRSATGSSGGSAAAVASGLVPMAHASDGGGSIRIPAGANGLFGFKPSRGRHAPSADDMFGLLSEHALTRTVRDSARLLSLTEDAARGPTIGFVAGPDSRRLRIGVYAETAMGEAPSAEVRIALERTASLCEELGHEVRCIDRPRVDGAAISRAFFDLAAMGILGIASMMEPMLGRPIGEGDFEPFTLALLARARSHGPSVVPEAMRGIAEVTAAMQAFLAEVDVALCPTSPEVAPRLGELAPDGEPDALIRRTERLAGYTPVHNMAGATAMSVPLFTDPSGLPIGSHFAASAGREATLLALAYELEAAAPWSGRRPAIVPSAGRG